MPPAKFEIDAMISGGRFNDKQSDATLITVSPAPETSATERTWAGME